jgi:hypothetical protein
MKTERFDFHQHVTNKIVSVIERGAGGALQTLAIKTGISVFRATVQDRQLRADITM